jgi:uncharacterized membrane protein
MTPAGRGEAQARADRIRLLRDSLQSPEVDGVLALTAEQRGRFEAWSRETLAALATQYDVDTTSAQKQVSWGMRIASTLGGLALCAAVALFFTRYWGYLDTPFQVLIVMALPLAGLAGTEFAARRERTLYFAGLMALVSLAAFVLNLSILGSIFNIVPTDKALLAWGLFAMLLAYRYGLRLLLVFGLGLLVSYVAGELASRLGYRSLDFGSRPEHLIVCGLIVFALPYRVQHRRNTDFAPVYRMFGALTIFLSVLSLAEWGSTSYLPFSVKIVERMYELLGLAVSAGAIWLGIRKQWNGIVNAGAVFFAVFLFCRLYHWWWDWMPQYLFFGIIGVLAIVLVVLFKRLRTRMEPAAHT